MYSSKDPSSYQHCVGEGGVSENDDESSNKVMETAYRCVKYKCTVRQPFCVLSRNFLARIVGIIDVCK